MAWKSRPVGGRALQVGRGNGAGKRDLLGGLCNTGSVDLCVESDGSRGSEERVDVVAKFVDREVVENPLSMPAHES